MTKFLNIIIILVASLNVYSQKDFMNESQKEKDMRMKWWQDATFGMFIHWGLYAIPAGEYNGKGGGAEWIMETHKIPTSEYEKFAAQFNPQKFNAREWVQTAKNAGMRYLVITSKHHDGFCLWDSKYTDYDVMDATPFKRDILKELSDACKKEGIVFGMYHSIMDWHHPDAKSKDYPHQSKTNPDFDNYRENYLKPQLKELVENYDPAILWFDGEWIPEWTEGQGKDLYNFVRNLKPSIIINNRVGKGRGGMQGMNKYKNAAGDFGTPEQEILEVFSKEYWESCITLNNSWGYSKEDQNWKSPQTIINTFVDISAKGGNLLLNVGPKADGSIPVESVKNLEEVGKWLKINQEAIFKTTAIPHFKEGDNLRFSQTQDNKYVYAIANNNITNELVIQSIKPLKGSTIHLIGTDRTLDWSWSKKKLKIQLPDNLPSRNGFAVKIEGISIGKGYSVSSAPVTVKHKAALAAVTYTTPPSDMYGSDKKNALTDGKLGTKKYDDGYWLGWFGHDIEAVIDLKKTKAVNHFTLHCLQNTNAWIVYPKSLTWWGSTDNIIWDQITHFETNASASHHGEMTQSFEYKTETKNKYRYIKVKAASYGTLPDGHQGAGNKAWVFADEIIVR